MLILGMIEIEILITFVYLMRLDSILKKVVSDISRPNKSRHYFDALNEREIGR
jgi:hypothetical protein